MRKVLNWVKSNYGDIPIHVQTAMSGKYRDLNEMDARTFIETYLNEILKGRYTLNGNYFVKLSLFGVVCITFNLRGIIYLIITMFYIKDLNKSRILIPVSSKSVEKQRSCGRLKICKFTVIVAAIL